MSNQQRRQLSLSHLVNMTDTYLIRSLLWIYSAFQDALFVRRSAILAPEPSWLIEKALDKASRQVTSSLMILFHVRHTAVALDSDIGSRWPRMRERVSAGKVAIHVNESSSWSSSFSSLLPRGLLPCSLSSSLTVLSLRLRRCARTYRGCSWASSDGLSTGIGMGRTDSSCETAWSPGLPVELGEFASPCCAES